MQIKFADEILECKQIETKPTFLRLGDILTGPEGMLLKVITVQKNCPMWESNRRTFLALLVETEDNTKIPLRNLTGKIEVLRPKKAA